MACDSTASLFLVLLRSTERRGEPPPPHTHTINNAILTTYALGFPLYQVHTVRDTWIMSVHLQVSSPKPLKGLHSDLVQGF